MDRRQLRWQGWGRIDHRRDLSNAEQDYLAEVLGFEAGLPQTPVPELSQLELPSSRIGKRRLGALADIVGDEAVRTDRFERVFHARGQSYHDLLHYRSGRLESAPDAVIYPDSADAVSGLLGWAAEHDMAVVPFGGGTSVVGGVTASAGAGKAGVITLDLSRLDQTRGIDVGNGRASFAAGIYGPALENALAGQGATLGHFPQSFEFSTLGGWIAARGAGQESNGYGTARHWFVGARVATPSASWTTEHEPASAAGPRLADLLVGSEGTLGVITSATVRIRPRPETRSLRAYLFPDFESGLACARRLAQTDRRLAMLRLSDADETRFQSRFAALHRSPSIAQRAFKWYLGRRGFGAEACLMLVASHGGVRTVDRAVRNVRWVAGQHGGQALGAGPGKTWYETRFEAPYLRDPLLDRGVGVDTLETAATWENLPELYAAVRDAIRGAVGTRGILMTHVSHTYRDGASLYFTYVFPRDPTDPIDQWWSIKRAASDAIMANRGTISHHHGVGEDHLEWMNREKDPSSLRILRSVKDTLDPTGLLNPGKLIP
ncbi:MAG: FAD-binding oxidoreductase [Xanthomonadales bacterium]|nr:FAD-binding oxidoreductase [Xanthomonadales bacterium]